MKKAISLEYDKTKSNAPIITSKGSGVIAQKIINIARQNDIAIKKDEDLLYMLSKIEVNNEIPSELYKAVAEVFSFIYQMSNKKDEQCQK